MTIARILYLISPIEIYKNIRWYLKNIWFLITKGFTINSVFDFDGYLVKIIYRYIRRNKDYLFYLSKNDSDVDLTTDAFEALYNHYWVGYKCNRRTVVKSFNFVKNDFINVISMASFDWYNLVYEIFKFTSIRIDYIIENYEGIPASVLFDDEHNSIEMPKSIEKWNNILHTIKIGVDDFMDHYDKDDIFNWLNHNFNIKQTIALVMILKYFNAMAI